MAAGNRSSLGFGIIFAFHLAILVLGVALQNLHASMTGTRFGLVLGGVLLGAGIWCFYYRQFVWGVFRSFKSAGVLLIMLASACILGTMLIQDLDLRRAGIFNAGLAPKGEAAPKRLDDKTKSGKFALAESHFIQWMFPGEQRRRLMREKVKLSPVEAESLALRRKAFGEHAAKAFEEGVLASKRRQVEHLTTSQYAQTHLPQLYSFWKFTRAYHLFDIFESWWFYFLLGLIAINVIGGTIARAPWNFRDFGLVATHAGVLIILTGALTDLCVSKEGYINFVYGRPDQETFDSIYDAKNRARHRLGFKVHLDRFATEYFHELAVERLDWTRRSDGSPWRNAEGPHEDAAPFEVNNLFPIRAGVTRLFENETIKVTIRKYLPRVFVTQEIEEDPSGPPNPGIKLALYTQPTGGPNLLVRMGADPWLFARRAGHKALDLQGFRFEYRWARSEAEYRRLLEQAPIPDNGTLILRRGSDEVRVPVELGGMSTVSLGGRDIDIRFLSIRSAFADEENVNLDKRLQHSEEPLLHLRVNGQKISVPRDDSEFLSGFDALKGVEFRFDWPNPRHNGVRRIFRIVAGRGLAPALVSVEARDRAVSQALAPGRPVALRDEALKGIFLGLEKQVRSGHSVRKVREVSNAEFLRAGGGRNDSLLAAWAEIEIDGPEGKVRKEITPYDRALLYGGTPGRPLYAFRLVRTGQARDWFSVLSVLDRRGRKVKTHAVQVNSPLKHRGYRFFQANAGTDAQGLGYSGISVTYNPGVYFMYLGYLVLTFGVCWLFFLRPVIDRRRRRRRKAEAGAR